MAQSSLDSLTSIVVKEGGKPRTYQVARVGISDTLFVNGDGILYVRNPAGEVELSRLISSVFQKLREQNKLPLYQIGTCNLWVNESGVLYEGREQKSSSLGINARLNSELETEAYKLAKRGE